MYAVVKTGGKQYKVAKGDVIRIEKMDKDIGATVDFSEVLLTSSDGKATVGAPYVKDAKVVGEVMSQGRAKKVKIIKFKRRKHHMKRQGHRQWFTEVKITDIKA